MSYLCHAVIRIISIMIKKNLGHIGGNAKDNSNVLSIIAISTSQSHSIILGHPSSKRGAFLLYGSSQIPFKIKEHTSIPSVVKQLPIGEDSNIRSKQQKRWQCSPQYPVTCTQYQTIWKERTKQYAAVLLSNKVS